jgi:hypothetical protein
MAHCGSIHISIQSQWSFAFLGPTYPKTVIYLYILFVEKMVIIHDNPLKLGLPWVTIFSDNTSYMFDFNPRFWARTSKVATRSVPVWWHRSPGLFTTCHLVYIIFSIWSNLNIHIHIYVVVYLCLYTKHVIWVLDKAVHFLYWPCPQPLLDRSRSSWTPFDQWMSSRVPMSASSFFRGG